MSVASRLYFMEHGVVLHAYAIQEANLIVSLRVRPKHGRAVARGRLCAFGTWSEHGRSVVAGYL